MSTASDPNRNAQASTTHHQAAYKVSRDNRAKRLICGPIPDKRQAQKLPPQGALHRPDMAALVKLLGGAAADLAARRLWHGARWREHDFVGWCAGDVGRDLVRARLQRRARCWIGFARLGQDNDALGARGSIGHAEYRDPALADAGDVGHGLLDLLRVEMAAGANDDVLDAAGDVDVASGHVGAVGAVEPTIVKELTGLRLVAEIAACRRRSTKLEPSLPSLAEFVTCLVDDANFVAGQWLAAGHDFERPWVFRLCRLGHAVSAQPIAVDAIDNRCATERRKRESDRALRKAIDRRHRLRGKAIATKTLDEPTQRLHADRLCAVRDHAQ